MNKTFTFLDKWAHRIMLPLVIIIFFKTCTTNSRLDKTSTDLTNKIELMDSAIISKIIIAADIQKMLIIEGLKAEKRMIQSTDRKILDVNRQSEIDKELQKLEK